MGKLNLIDLRYRNLPELKVFGEVDHASEKCKYLSSE